MIKKKLFYLIFVLVIFFFSNNFVFAKDPVIISDSLNRTIKIDYINDSQDIVYDYYGNTENMRSIRVGDDFEIYVYDERGNLLSERYSVNSSYDRYYLYYADDNLKQISGGGSRIMFDYYPNETLRSESVVVDGDRLLVTNYEYDSNNSLIKIVNLNSRTVYEYDSTNRLVKEEVLTEINGGEYETIESVEYEYDEKDNIIRMIDGVGIDVEYFYQNINYSCTEYDEGNDSFVDSICSYSKLIGQKINNYEINYTGDDDFERYRGNTWDTNYTPIYEYDEEGYLTRFDDMYYQYSENYSALDSIRIEDVYGDDLNVDFNYSETDLLESSIYSSEFGGFGEGYFYDPLGRVVKKSFSEEDFDSGITGDSIRGFFTGNFIKNILTGFNVLGLGDSSEFVVYYATPGDGYSEITTEEYLELIKSENIWPELATYYEGIIDEEGNINASWISSSCFNSDIGEDEIHIGGYVEYDNQIAHDYCLDNNTLVESFCGRVLKLDFWNLEPKTFNRVCQFGCEMGRCLTAEEVMPGEPVELDLPDEPSAPGNI